MEQCIFCRIVRGELPCQKVYETDTLLAFRDIHPVAPVHILLIPKWHVASFHHLSQPLTDDGVRWLADLAVAARVIAEQEGIATRGYRLITNYGEEGGQVVGHLHVHLLGGEPIGPMRTIVGAYASE